MKKVTVITGGAGGMGLATAKLIGKENHVVICDVNPKRIETALAELKALKISADSMICDITDKISVAALVKVATSLGEVRSVIHTAGISPQMGDALAVMKINALGTINIVEAFYPLATEGFVIVNVASMGGYMMPNALLPKGTYPLALTNPAKFLKKSLFMTALFPKGVRSGLSYSISKNFVIWYTRTSAAKFGQKGARILSVSPGTINTEMGRLEEKSGSMDMLKFAALKRPGKPEEIAELLTFCASDKASYITGTDILCDGGVVAGRVKI